MSLRRCLASCGLSCLPDLSACGSSCAARLCLGSLLCPRLPPSCLGTGGGDCVWSLLLLGGGALSRLPPLLGGCLLPLLPPSSRLGGGGEALRLLSVLDASSRCLFGGGDLRGSFSLSFPFPWLLEPDGSSGLPPAAALQALDFDSNFPPLASAMSARESARACCSRAL